VASGPKPKTATAGAKPVNQDKIYATDQRMALRRTLLAGIVVNSYLIRRFVSVETWSSGSNSDIVRSESESRYVTIAREPQSHKGNMNRMGPRL
jgi:hypothetical protein